MRVTAQAPVIDSVSPQFSSNINSTVVRIDADLPEHLRTGHQDQQQRFFLHPPAQIEIAMRISF